MRPARFEREASIRFAHCDPAGIVYFPQYFVMFNGLIEDWFNDGLGVNYTDLISTRRVGLPTVSLQTEFRAPSRFGDAVTLSLAVVRMGSKSIRLQLTCCAGKEQRATVEQVLVTTRLDTHVSVDIPADIRAAIDRVHPEVFA